MGEFHGGNGGARGGSAEFAFQGGEERVGVDWLLKHAGKSQDGIIGVCAEAVPDGAEHVDRCGVSQQAQFL